MEQEAKPELKVTTRRVLQDSIHVKTENAELSVWCSCGHKATVMYRGSGLTESTMLRCSQCGRACTVIFEISVLDYDAEKED